MPGSGKTTIGKELAKQLNADFIDLDSYIIAKEKLSIPQIFKTKGETYFRRAETTALTELLTKKKPGVVALGGGTPCFNGNMQRMNESGKTVYLIAPVAVLARRIEADITIRPLFNKLNGDKLEEKIASMLAHRKQFYGQASISIDTENETAASLAKLISEKI